MNPKKNQNAIHLVSINVFKNIFLHTYFRVFFYLKSKIQENGGESLYPDQFPEIEYQDDPANHLYHFQKKLQANMSNQREFTKVAFFKSLMSIFRRDIIIFIITYLICGFFKFADSFSLRYVIQYSNNKDSHFNTENPYFWGLMLCISLCINALLVQNLMLYTYLYGIKIRNLILNFVYSRVLALSQNSCNKSNIGKIINLANNDLNGIEIYFSSILITFLSPLFIVASCLILYSSLGGYGTIGVAILFLSLPFQIVMAAVALPYLNEKQKYQDRRLAQISEFIQQIRTIKMYGLEDLFSQKIEKTRKKEYSKMFTFWMKFMVTFAISMSSGMLSSAIIFLIINRVSQDQVISIEVIFQSVQIIDYLRNEIFSQVTFALQAAVKIQVALQRMADVANVDNQQMLDLSKNIRFSIENAYEQQDQPSINSFSNIKQQKFSSKLLQSNNQSKTSDLILFQDLSLYWQKEGDPQLRIQQFSIQKGSKIGIVGQVGGGKSTLVNAILREVPFYKGTCQMNFESLSIMTQTPEVFVGTIRDNIILEDEFNSEQYERVLEASQIKSDLQQFELGDQTYVKEQGVIFQSKSEIKFLNLSGGQRARIAIARALYKDSELYIFDEPFAALDNKVGNKIFEKIFHQFLKNKTIILVCNQVNFLQKMDSVAIIKDKQILHQGSYSQIEKEIKEVTSKNQNSDEQVPEIEEVQRLATFKTRKISQDILQEPQDDENEMIECLQKTETPTLKNRKEQDQDDEEANETVVISLETVKKQWYAANSNLRLLWAVFAYSLSQSFIVAYYRVLSFYEETENKDLLLMFLFIIIVCYFFSIYLKFFAFAARMMHSVNKIHYKMIKVVSMAKTQYFDSTPAGRIINRFTGDFQIIDFNLIVEAMECLECAFAVIIGSIVIVSFVPLVFFPQLLMFMLSAFNFIRFRKFVYISRKIDLQQKSPLFQNFNSVATNLISIRVYRKTQEFLQKQLHKSTNSLKASYITFQTAKTFQIINNMILLTGLFFTIFFSIFYLEKKSTIGQIFIFLFIINSLFTYCLDRLMAFTISLTSTQRCINVTQIEPEQELVRSTISEKDEGIQLQNPQSEQNFLQKGFVNFKNIRMRYNSNSQQVLKGINLKISQNEKIGIVGRTGSGKSSLVNCLFRMYEIENFNNSGIQIDNTDIRLLGLHTLRLALAIIPQIPFLFSFSLRENLDLTGIYKGNDEALWEILREIQLEDKVNSLDQKLDTIMTEQQSDIFSVGQKQLICLARILLVKDVKILVLDEASAFIDSKTNEMIQDFIRQKFQQCTIISIAHRLNTIAAFDRVIVLDKGDIVEEGKPYELIAQSNKSSQIDRETLFANLVSQSGKKNAKQFFEVAKETFLQTHNPQKV